MRAAKPGDSPSGASRDVYPIRAGAPRHPADRYRDVGDYVGRVNAEVFRLLKEFPHLDVEDPRVLLSRMVTPETLVGYDSALRRAAFGVLHLRAVDRAEHMDFTSGGDAA